MNRRDFLVNFLTPFLSFYIPGKTFAFSNNYPKRLEQSIYERFAGFPGGEFAEFVPGVKKRLDTNERVIALHLMHVEKKGVMVTIQNL